MDFGTTLDKIDSAVSIMLLFHCRVPKNETGPLDTFWKIRDSEGYVLNNDGTRSACIHQWDRWYKELVKFIDHKTF
jgi:hypothetical protein